MQPQPFRTEELKANLEGRLGFALSSLERLDGASALNFKAVRASDGFVFAVKCWAENRRELFELTKEHLVDLKGSMAVQRIFEAECPEDFAGCKRLCVSWCPGVRRFPDTLSDDEYRRFLDDILGFFSDLQRVKQVGPAVPALDIKRRTLAKCRGVGGWILRKVLEAIPDDALTYREEFVRNIHSDFHHGNFLFDNGRVAGFMDLEEIRKGYPTEDLMRYLVCAKEHLRWYAFSRVRRTRWCFREAVRRLPYTEHEWLLGIATRFMIKVSMNTGRKTRIDIGTALNLWYKGLFYKALAKDVLLRKTKTDFGFKDLKSATPRQVFMNSDAQGINLLLVAVNTLLKHNDPTKRLTLFVAHDRSFEEQGCKALVNAVVARYPFASVHYLDFAPWQAAYDGDFNHMLWAFPLLEKILPKEVTGKILYIDIDMLIRKDLGELFDLDLKTGNYIAAAVNESRREHRPYLVNAGWPKSAGYSFNNATTLIDLEAFRAANATERMIAWYRANKAIAVNTDQDAQNMIYGDRTFRIPLKWNYTDGWLERVLKMNPFAKEWRVHDPKDVLEAILDPCIIHYIGVNKPTEWTHRPERKAFHRELRELGLLTGRIPGETYLKRIVAVAFDVYHLLLRGYVKVLSGIRKLISGGRV